MTNMPFSLKIAVKPLLILVLLISVSVIGLSKAFYKIGSLKEGLSDARKSENVLKSKLDILSGNVASVATDANHAASFLPGENPALLVLYQLRSNIVKSELFPSKLNVGPEVKDPGGFMTVSISFDVEGPLQKVLDFVNSIRSTAPNVWIEKTEIDFTGDILQASIDTKSYWSPFPTKIPALTEPITSLDDSEKEIIRNVSGFSLPPFVTLTPEAPRENLTPFGE